MIGIYVLAAQVIMFLLFYPMIVMGKRADEELRMLSEKRLLADNQKEEEDNMESQRDFLRTIEREINKGSAPVRFDGMGFNSDTYHLVESEAKLNQLYDYFFRNGEYAALADRQVRSNVYMDAHGRKVNFRPAKSEMDRRGMEASAKRWMKKKHPSFDGDVYVENVRCFLKLPEDEKEKRRCVVDGTETTALIFSGKHLAALYLQCLVHRKEIVQHTAEPDGFSEICSRIYRLEDVDVLFQCLLMDQMQCEDHRLSVQFNTVYMVKKG